jgi:hypothetical protein
MINDIPSIDFDRWRFAKEFEEVAVFVGRSLSSLSGAFDRCIAVRMACVVVALPWSICPITSPEVSGQLD